MGNITKDDLRLLRILLVSDLEKLFDRKLKTIPQEETQEWLRSKAIRQILNISPSTLQNIRITGKLRLKKVLGSYYYNKADLLKLFENGR